MNARLASPYGRPAVWRWLWDGLRVLLRLMLGQSHVVPREATILVLDVIEPYAPLWSESKTVVLNRLLRRARASGHRVVFTRWDRVREWPRDVVAERGHWSYFLPHRGAGIIRGVDWAEEDAVVPVVHTNALCNESVREAVGDGPLLLAGMWTESCVSATAKAAAEEDREAIVYAPACGGHAQLYALWVIEQMYARVCSDVSFSEPGRKGQ